MNNRRVVVTGLGIVSNAGIGVNKIWNKIKLGHSLIDNIKLFDVDGINSKVG